jgi:PIN domain nuclease of toxin-antitoxin system
VGRQQGLIRVYLLDTHVWIWHVEGDTQRVGRRTMRLLSRAAARDELRVSPLTIFEVAQLHASGRLHLTHPLDEWIAMALSDGGVRLAPLTMEMAREAGWMGGVDLPDPIDRLLAMTARYSSTMLVTRDGRILDYAQRTGTVRVQDASI